MLQKADIRDVWDWIRPGIEEIMGGASVDWRPEDLYACCLYGQAEIYMDPETGGFLITQERQMPFKNEKFLLLWVGHDKGGEAFHKHIREVESIALAKGCSHIEFWSSRKGMARLGSKYGYEPLATVYTKVL